MEWQEYEMLQRVENLQGLWQMKLEVCHMRVVEHLSRLIFMLNLTERLYLLLDIDTCQRRQVTWIR